jgi:Recombinase zinc beta ribbon domain
VSKYRKSLKSSGRLRPRSEWLPLILPEKLRLIDRDQWRRVQEQLSRNITFSPRNSKHQYPLKGLVKCGACSARYVGDPCHGTYYYRCHARCKNLPTIKEEYLDGTVWNAIEEAVLNPELIAGQIEDLTANRVAVTEQQESEESEIVGALSELRTEEARILEAYRKSIITPEQLGVELEQINARKSALEARASHISRNAASPAPVSKRSLYDWCQSAAKGLQRFTNQDRQRFLRLLVNEIVFEGERIRIRGVIPVPTSKDDSHSLNATFRQQNGCDPQSQTAITPVYRIVRNTVYGVTFELVRSVPQRPPTLREQLDDFFIRSLVNRYPGFTLQELCEQVKQERGVTLHNTSMDKILLRLGLTHRVRQQLIATGRQRVDLAA